MIEPQRELSTTALANIKTVRSYNAFGEVARETSALGLDGSGNPVETGSLTYTYNTMGRVIKRESPQVAVTSATGATSNVRPTEEYYYDKSGRMLASRDANGNLTRYTLLAGTGYGGAQALIAETVAADGGVTRVRYDIHGDARQIETPLYNASTAPQYKRLQSFDKLGRLIQLTQEGGLVQSYEYDGLGQRTKYWNSQLGSSKAELIAYDHQGRIAQVTTMGGDVTAYAYGWNGSLATSGMATYGGWTKTTTYANAKTLIESTDVFGRDVSRTDLGGNVSNFVYDKAGRLLQRTGGSTLTYSYYNTGKLKMLAAPAMWQETIVGSGPLGGTEITTARDTGFEYDKIGNLTKQWTGEAGTFTSNGYYDGEHQWVAPETTDFSRIVSTQTATYDALGRLTAWADSGYQDTRPRLRVPPTSHVFQYDANGNVRRSLATYRAIDAQGAYASTDTTQDYWYAYDAMNRMVISKGQLVSGAVARGTTGISMAFDLGGRRAYAIIQEAGTAKREDYTYDAENRLVETKSGTNVSTPGTKRADFTYDLMGRVTLQRDYDTNGTTILYSRSVTYNDKSQVASDSTATKRGSIIYTANSDYDYGTGSSYALGSPLTIMTYDFENGVAKKTNKTLNTYSWRDGAQLDKTEYWNDWVGQPTVKNTSLYVYDVFGGKAQLREVGIADARPRSVMFLYDLMGQIIKRDEKDNVAGAGDPHEVWYRFSGRQIGYVGNNGTLDTTYAQSIANRTASQGNGAFFNGASGATSAADFDLASDSLNSYAQGSNAGMYVVQAGDTLSSIAANLWGDSSLWYKLAEINGLTAESELPEGLPLIIPTGVIRDTNNASTFKPYDPNELMGNLSPTAVAPPKKGNKCGVIGQILMVVIAVVVIALTRVPVGNFFSGLFGVAEGATSGTAFTASAIATGATTAAAGSIASQAFGVATGIQEKFSWNAVALAAIGGGVGGGMGAKFPNMGDVPRAVVSNVITQGIGVATGLQKEFSWAGVATAALMPSVRRAVGAMLPATVSDFAYTVAQSSAALIVNAATRSLIEGSDFGDNIIAALPDVAGQMIGDAIADRIAGRSSSPLYAKDARRDAERRYGPGAYYEAGKAIGRGSSHWYDGIVSAFHGAMNWLGDLAGFDNGHFSLGNIGLSGTSGAVDDEEIVVTANRRDRPRVDPYIVNSNGRVESTWMQSIQALGSQPMRLPTYEQVWAYEAATNPLLYRGPVDHMGQPLYGPSHYDALEAFGDIMDNVDEVPLSETFGRLWDLGNYRVPDAAQRAAARQAAEQEWALIDQLRTSPLAGASYGISATLGADTEQRQAWANVGTIADGLLISRAAASRGSAMPAYMNAQRSLYLGAPEEYYAFGTAIDMRRAPSSSPRNAAGYPRNGRWYFGQLAAQNPEWFNVSNMREIRAGRNPVVNEQWVRYHPEHQAFVGDQLVHHHAGQGPIAVAIPLRVHEAWYSSLHQNTARRR